jgi:hypothetical protein
MRSIIREICTRERTMREITELQINDERIQVLLFQS